jgi:16S rRNA (cytidine1402-2'-O)-methyltransferase
MVYLIPTVLLENINETIPHYIVDAIKKCTVFYVENERTTRRFFKSIWKEMVIDDYKWVTIHKAEQQVAASFLTDIKANKNIGIVSEAGCPGIADPGQILIALAQKNNVVVKPLVGPSSILLSLMASGFNGQEFTFNGYLPIDATERNKKLKQIETIVHEKGCTQLFIETPYRNNQLLEALIKNCTATTLLCIAVNITGPDEMIQTKNLADWKKVNPDLHKKPCIFLMGKMG